MTRSGKHADAAEAREDAPATAKTAMMLAQVGLTCLILAQRVRLDNAAVHPCARLGGFAAWGSGEGRPRQVAFADCAYECCNGCVLQRLVGRFAVCYIVTHEARDINPQTR